MLTNRLDRNLEISAFLMSFLVTHCPVLVVDEFHVVSEVAFHILSSAVFSSSSFSPNWC